MHQVQPAIGLSHSGGIEEMGVLSRIAEAGEGGQLDVGGNSMRSLHGKSLTIQRLVQRASNMQILISNPIQTGAGKCL